MTIQPETVAAAQNFDLAHRYDDPARRSWGWLRVSDEQVARLIEGAAPLLAAQAAAAERERIRQLAIDRDAACKPDPSSAPLGLAPVPFADLIGDET